MDPQEIIGRVESTEALDQAAPVIEKVVDAMPEPTRKFLSGDWLGHSLHPALTDLPIGFWTTSWLLDLVGRKRSARTATVMVGLGVASAVPTLAAGLVEFTKLPAQKRRAGVAHMVCNVLATWFYAMSFISRLRGKRGSGIALGMVAASVATAGGYLGGHLAYGRDNQDAASFIERPVDPSLRVAV
jgi:uncharacterized membrane protein